MILVLHPTGKEAVYGMLEEATCRLLPPKSVSSMEIPSGMTERLLVYELRNLALDVTAIAFFYDPKSTAKFAGVVCQWAQQQSVPLLVISELSLAADSDESEDYREFANLVESTVRQHFVVGNLPAEADVDLSPMMQLFETAWSGRYDLDADGRITQVSRRNVAQFFPSLDRAQL